MDLAGNPGDLETMIEWEIEQLFIDRGVFLGSDDKPRDPRSYNTVLSFSRLSEVWPELRTKYTYREWVQATRYWLLDETSPVMKLLAAEVLRMLYAELG